MWPFKKVITNGLYPYKDEVEFRVNGFTWDAAKLEQHAHQPVFIYDIHKRRMRAHALIDSWSEYRGVAFTAQQTWTMWKKKLGEGTFPIAMRIPYTMVDPCRIKGELYLIDTNRIFILDEIMSNGVEFRRKKVDILLPYRHTKRIVNAAHNYETEYTDIVYRSWAWMYIGRHTYWKDFLDGGYHFKPCARYTPGDTILSGSYYEFTELELND